MGAQVPTVGVLRAPGWPLAREQGTRSSPVCLLLSSSRWVVLSSLMKLWALGARLGSYLFKILPRERMALLRVFAVLPAAPPAFLPRSSSTGK